MSPAGYDVSWSTWSLALAGALLALSLALHALRRRGVWVTALEGGLLLVVGGVAARRPGPPLVRPGALEVAPPVRMAVVVTAPGAFEHVMPRSSFRDLRVAGVERVEPHLVTFEQLCREFPPAPAFCEGEALAAHPNRDMLRAVAVSLGWPTASRSCPAVGPRVALVSDAIGDLAPVEIASGGASRVEVLGGALVVRAVAGGVEVRDAAVPERAGTIVPEGARMMPVSIPFGVGRVQVRATVERVDHGEGVGAAARGGASTITVWLREGRLECAR